MAVALLGGWVYGAPAQLSGGLPAQRASSPRYIQRIDIEGNHEVSADKIRRVLRLRVGDRLDAEKVEEGLKRLFATRQFDDIQAWRVDTRPDSTVLSIVVSEYPRIDELRIQGNDKVEKEDLEKVVVVSDGTFVRPALLNKDRDAITELYKEKGYYRAAVRDTIVRDQNRNVMVYQITEGRKVSVEHIDFIGNKQLDSAELRAAMDTKTDAWWRGADFKPTQLEQDKERILNLYKSEGFLDAQINDTELHFSEDGEGLDVFLVVEEGRRYYTGGFSWTGNDLFPDSTIARFITLERGDPLDESALGQIQFNLGNMYWDRGYIYSTVTPVKNVRGDTVDVEIDITQGNLAHVNEINIIGNTKTAEWVIRRELVLRPGDVFTASRLRRSLREVFNLGFFAGPPVPNFVPANEQGDVDLTLRVEEKPAGQFRMGAGFSQLNRISGFIGITEPNFLGKGLRVSLDWEFSRYRQNVNVSFTEPWLRGTPTRLTLNVFSRNQNQVRQQFFSDRRTGFSIGLGRPFPWMDYSTLSGRYLFEEVALSNFVPEYRGPLLDLQGAPQRTSSVGLTFLRNSTDNPFHPTMGTRFVFDTRWAGGVLGGDVNYQRYTTSLAWYQRLFWVFVQELKGDLGVLDGYGGDSEAVPQYELFRLGGNRTYGLRGYDFYEVVPEGNEAFVGGRFFTIFTYEVSFPVAPPTVYGLFFFDAGNTWNSFEGADLSNLRRGAGIGIRIELPMLGTVGMDYGYGFDRGYGRFRFSGWEPHITFGGAF